MYVTKCVEINFLVSYSNFSLYKMHAVNIKPSTFLRKCYFLRDLSNRSGETNLDHPLEYHTSVFVMKKKNLMVWSDIQNKGKSITFPNPWEKLHIYWHKFYSNRIRSSMINLYPLSFSCSVFITIIILTVTLPSRWAFHSWTIRSSFLYYQKTILFLFPSWT